MEEQKNIKDIKKGNNLWMIIVICLLIISIGLFAEAFKGVKNNKDIGTNKEVIKEENMKDKKEDTYSKTNNFKEKRITSKNIEEYNKKMKEEEERILKEKEIMKKAIEENIGKEKEKNIEPTPNTYIIFVNNSGNKKILSYLKDLDKEAGIIKDKYKKVPKIEINVLNYKAFDIFNNIKEFYENGIYDYEHFTNKKCSGISYVILDNKYEVKKSGCKKVIPIKKIGSILINNK